MTSRPLSKKELQKSISKRINADLEALEKLPDFDNKEYLKELLHDFLINVNSRNVNPDEIGGSINCLMVAITVLMIGAAEKTREKIKERRQELGLPKENDQKLQPLPSVKFAGKSPLKTENRMTLDIARNLKAFAEKYHNMEEVEALKELNSQNHSR